MPKSVFLDEIEIKDKITRLLGVTVPKGVGVVPIATPPAGSEFEIVVPSGERWLVYSLKFTLATDPTVATRYVHIVVDDGVNIAYCGYTGKLAENRTYNFGLADCGQGRGGTDYGQYPHPVLVLESGYRMRSVTANLQVGDQFSDIFVLRARLDA